MKAVAGFDATFSAPKSLSVLWALTRDERLLAAHDVAVEAALTHVERFGSTTRVRSAGGRLHPDSQGLTIAAFGQTTSRADDPQIHTHCVVSAKVQTDAGRWLALDARYLKRLQRMLGVLYQSVLRNELAHRFGIDWGTIKHGQAEMAAMPEDLLGRRRPEPQLRCAVPHWFEDLANNITARLQRAQEASGRIDAMTNRLDAELDSARRRLLEAERLLDPHSPALDSARAVVEAAQQQLWSSNSALDRARAIKRAAGRRTMSRARDELAEARGRLAAVEAAASPATIALSNAHDEIRRAERSIANLPVRRAFTLGNVDIDQLRELSEALDIWRRWATSFTVSLEASADVLEIFGRTGLPDRVEVLALSTPLADWAAHHGFEPELHVDEDRRSVEFDLEP